MHKLGQLPIKLARCYEVSYCMAKLDICLDDQTSGKKVS